MTATDEFKDLEPAKHAIVSTAQGVAALALNMALRYHNINTVQDGALYQQYKLEARNMTTLHLDHVFETAIKMEAHLLGASERFAKLVVDAIVEGAADVEARDEIGANEAESESDK